MTICELCGSNEYEEIYGMFYCKLCNTLSQSHGVGQDAAVDNTNYHGSQLIKLVNPFASQETKKSDIQAGGYRPWKTLEGFQFVLKQQVEALISLGIQPELKELVFKIWVGYLQCTKQAFIPISNNKEVKERLRDKYISKSRNNIYVTKSKIRAWIYRQHKIKMKIKLKNAEIESSTNIEDNIDDDDDYNINNNIENMDYNANGYCKDTTDCHNNNNMDNKSIDDNNIDNNIPIIDAISSVSFKATDKKVDTNKFHKDILNDVTKNVDYDAASLKSEDCEEYMQSIDDEINDSLSSELQFSLFRMSLHLTLSILHAALLFFDGNVLANDLIKLVKLKKLPYTDLKNWPEDMLLNISDHIIFFRKNIPTPEQVTYNTYKLFKLLNLSLLKDPSFEDICLRLLLELNLPIQVFHVVQCVLSKLSLTQHQLNSNFYFNILKLDFGTFCLAVIIVALKIIFLLDDSYENVISDCGAKLRSQLPLRDKVLFNWKTWRSYTNKRLKCTTIENIRDLESYCSPNAILDNYGERQEQKVHTQKSCYDNQRRQKFDNLLKSFNEMMREESHNSDISDTEFDKTKSTFDKTKNEFDQIETEFDQTKTEFLQPNSDLNPFQNQDILYALDGQSFIKQFNENANQIIPPDLISQFQCKKFYHLRPMTAIRSLRNADIKYRNNLGMQEQLSHFKWTKSRRKNKLKLSTTELKDNGTRDNNNEINKTSLNANIANRKRLKAVRKLTNANNGKIFVHFASYHWLLDACGRLLDYSQMVVDKYVQRIEKKLFDFRIVGNKKIAKKKAVCKNILFPKAKVMHIKRQCQLSMQKLKNLLKGSKN